MLKQWENDVISLRNKGASWRQAALDVRKRYKELQRFSELTMIRKCRNVREKIDRRGDQPPQETLIHEESVQTGASPENISAEPLHRYKNGIVESICLIELWDGEDLTPEKLLAFHKLDPDKWTVISYTTNIWHAMTGKDLNNERRQMYQSKVVARPKADGISLEEIDRHFALLDRTYTPPVIRAPRAQGHMMAEVNIADLHLGRLSWHGDTSCNYDHRIARDMFSAIVSEVYHELKGKPLEYITFVWSNDFFNSDTVLKTTTNGTPQDTDIRWQKLFNIGTEMLVDAITMLSGLAPVRTFYTASNHDKMTSYHAIKYLEAWFRKDKDIDINTDAKARKYQLYGNTLLGYAHGAAEKPARLASMMPNEARALWGNAVTREMHAAHLHSEHAIEEVNGVIVRRISSPTASDTWTDEAGFGTAVRKAQTFLYERERGLLQIINTPV